jgi:hypothetical protein
MTDIIVKQMPSFKKSYKRLNANQKSVVNDAIRSIIDLPKLDQEKKGNLSGVFVHKFTIKQQLMLLAYEWDPKKRILLALGVHENFYRDLKR